MPFGRNTHVVPSNSVLDRDSGPTMTGRCTGRYTVPPVKVRIACIANCDQTVTDSGTVTSLQELSNALSNGTIADPIYDFPFPENNMSAEMPPSNK